LIYTAKERIVTQAESAGIEPARHRDCLRVHSEPSGVSATEAALAAWGAGKPQLNCLTPHEPNVIMVKAVNALYVATKVLPGNSVDTVLHSAVWAVYSDHALVSFSELRFPSLDIGTISVCPVSVNKKKKKK